MGKRLRSGRRKYILKETKNKMENSKGKKWTGDEMERNKAKEQEFVFVCDECGKVCRSKGGLTNHKSALKKKFPCKKTQRAC